MSKMVKEIENKLNEAIALAVEKATQSGDLPEAEMPKFIIEKPADKKKRRLFIKHCNGRCTSIPPSTSNDCRSNSKKFQP